MGEFLLYLLGIGAIALLVGFLIGFVARGVRVRKQIDPLETEVARLRSQLAATRDTSTTSAPPKPQRLTGTEIAAIVAAAGTLATGLSALVVNFRNDSVKTLEAKVTALQEKADAADARRAQVEKTTHAILKADIGRWERAANDISPVPTSSTKPRRAVPIDYQTLVGKCDDPAAARLLYEGTGPAILRCEGKTVTVQISKPTRVLLLTDPDGLRQAASK